MMDIPRGLYNPPTKIPGNTEDHGRRVQIGTNPFKPGQTFARTLQVDPVFGWPATSTIFMRDPVATCVPVPDDTRHNVPAVSPWPATSLEGYLVLGKTVAQVRPEIGKRGLKVTYLITEPRPEGDR
ncbi:hypothetical protein ACIBQ1_37620 [Nonomuraea sp. NPDC050153]|uniref:hypothetical protein n=1 Tax=Nonomuraea sp. NPDC050153 TaxID=3364359 RepID=UPI0037B9CA17